jgi:hypothetical protein
MTTRAPAEAIDWQAPEVRAICACPSGPDAWRLLQEYLSSRPKRKHGEIRDAIWARRRDVKTQLSRSGRRPL